MEKHGYRAEDAYAPEVVNLVVTATLQAALDGVGSHLARKLREEVSRIGAERGMASADIDQALCCAGDFIRQGLRDRNGA